MEIYVLLIGVLIILGTLIEIGKNGNWSAALAVPGRRPVWSVNFCFWLMIGGILILFGGLRYQVGDDFDSYYLIFENISEDWGTILYEGTETGYVWLNRLVSVWTDNPQWIMVVTTAIISLCGLAAICRESKLVPFSLFVFFTTIYYQGFNLIRQCIACAMVLLALSYAKRDEWIRACLWLVLASLFHRTALVCIPVFILARFQYRPVFLVLFLGGCCLSFLLREPLNHFLLAIYPTAAEASDSYLYESISPVQVILCGIYMALCLKYYRSMLERAPGNVMYVNLSVFLFGIYTFFYWIPMCGRLQLYFIGMYALIAPEVISCEKNRKLRVLYYAVIWGILLFFFIVPKLSGDIGTWEYQTIFSQR